MASSAECWSQGKRQWWISHEGENGPRGLEVDGHPPDGFPTIRQEMEALQLAAGGDAASVDYLFDIPLAVAKTPAIYVLSFTRLPLREPISRNQSLEVIDLTAAHALDEYPRRQNDSENILIL